MCHLWPLRNAICFRIVEKIASGSLGSRNVGVSVMSPVAGNDVRRVSSPRTTRLTLLPRIALALGMAVIVLILPAAALTGREIGFFTRDPTQIGQVPYYAGVLSSLGVLTWTTGAVIALFTAGLHRLIDHTDGSTGFLGYFGVFTLVLALDDLFLIHENFFLGEKVLFLIYGVMALIGCVLFRRHFHRPSVYFAIGAALAFAASLGVDRGQETIEAAIGGARILLEDGAKFIGAICWAIFLSKASARSLLDRVQK